jgi:putative membrane protein
MIKYNPKTWFGQIFLFPKSDTLRILWLEMVIIGIITGGILWIIDHYFADTVHKFKNTISVHSLVGVVMGLFLVFRTNTAYDRWWEGRRLWGALVNCSRNASFKISHFITGNSDLKSELLFWLQKYPIAVKDHLRDNASYENAGLEKDQIKILGDINHLPNAIANRIYALLKKALDAKEISGDELVLIDREIQQLTDIVGACERIRSTPIPYSYSLFMKKFIFIYCISLPIGLIPDFRIWAIPITMFIFYIMVSLEVLAEEIEDPFGLDENDLPTDEIADRIANNIREIAGQK